MRSSIATVSVSGTLGEKLAAIAAAGFDGIELFEPDLIASPMSPREIVARSADLGLRIELYQPFRDFEAMPEPLYGQSLRRAAAKFDLMAELGVDLLLVCSNVSPEAIDDPDLAAAQLHALGELAAERGARIAYEALGWGRHVRHYADSYDIVRRADHPAVGVCLDSFHVMSVGDELDAIATIDPRSLFFVQLADAPHLTMDVLQLSRHHRCFPGQGVFDVPRFTAQVLRAGYRGPLSLEVFSDSVRSAPAVQTARDAMRSVLCLQELTDAVLDSSGDGDTDVGATNWSATRGGAARGPGTRPVARLSELHPVPRLDGVAFVEVGVAEAATPELSALLALFGFSRVGVHRSKSVTLWQQGDVRIVLNCERHVGDGPSVIGVGIHTPDVRAAVRRAADLHWAFNDQPHGPGEAELPSITTPMGIDLFFGAADGPQPWRADFIDTSDRTVDVGLRAVDHLGGSVAPDLYDAEISLYRSLLGMTPGPVTEINRPRGQVHSRALVSSNAALRLVISAGFVGRPTPPGLEQIALSTPDAARTVAELRRRGARMLAIPDNYYADLAARYDLPAARLAELRSLGLLYDRSAAGEFVHAYSASIGGLFFEFVQRTGSYTGYGESDAPVRMAVQDPAPDRPSPRRPAS